jgi:two-component sensor histidine kinase
MAFVDATAQQKKEADHAILVGELRHRVKNLLGVVQALARQTMTKGRTGEEYRDAFLGRLNALVAAHELDVSESDGIEVRELIDITLTPYRSGSGRTISAQGPSVSLSPAQTFSMSMILHELATNAAKHGALSSPGGKVKLVWQIESREAGRRLKLRWEEQGGPPVAAAGPPGFGTRLIEFAMRHDLGGEAELSSPSNGFKAELEVPIT